MKNERVATNYAVSREMKRELARRQLKKEGNQHINKVYHYLTYGLYSKKPIPKTEPSLFSKEWRAAYDRYVAEVFN